MGSPGFYMSAITPAFCAIMSCWAILQSGYVLADDEQEIAKQAQNPVASVISVPLQNNLNFGVGPNVPQRRKCGGYGRRKYFALPLSSQKPAH
jgi:hypothetical protein